MAKDKRNDRNKEFKIPDDVKRLVKLNFKKFKKNEGDYYDSKKDLKRAYYAQIIDLIPAAIGLVIKYGHVEAVKEIKDKIYEKITDPKFVKYLRKEIKDGCEFDNMILLPTIIYDIVAEAHRAAEAAKAENPDTETSFDVDDLVQVSRDILKKRIKKLTKAGVDEGVAFDVLSVIPTPKILVKSPQYHIRRFFTVLYEHSKTNEVKFEKIVNEVFKDDAYKNAVITFALLERKEKIANFTDTQKKLFNDITEYCFSTMEEMKKDEIYDILKSYTDVRKRDESQGKDTNRRYYISSLPESDYPRILKTVNRLCENDDKLKKYF